MKIGIFYGTTTGNTRKVAQDLQHKLASFGDVELYDVAECGIDPVSDYDLVVLGTPTWGVGDLQDDWLPHQSLPDMDLSGKKVALFGLGDQIRFADTFVDGMGVLAYAAEEAGAELVGMWPTGEYDFTDSAALRDGRFVGLALDMDNEPELTDDRLDKWVNQLQEELQA